ncbi:GNAT family N-acetyltransferase [Aliiglaciecola sp. CAU 1673]|uniref:GNAT family N-acetyltransferase n=1 Tax=Aliiglaciecola sp. CAU 1673 TaxID=3032595 RepID=UPI0023DC30C9|nr:GNAT family N-acetyltransferase [Aliiglaciecola sp. CAU 1673]MDF2178790.1 GNAT family N-acetyltransferase [Aliiglaciecola sp. CAU 1673]
MELRCVKAGPGDWHYLMALRKSTMVEHLEIAGIFLTDEQHAERLASDYDCSNILLLDDVPIGTLKLKEQAHQWDILQLQIHPDFQGQGIGALILNRLISMAKNNGVRLFLTVLKANPAAKFYVKSGFEFCGEDRHEFHMCLSPS